MCFTKGNLSYDVICFIFWEQILIIDAMDAFFKDELATDSLAFPVLLLMTMESDKLIVRWNIVQRPPDVAKLHCLERTWLRLTLP